MSQPSTTTTLASWWAAADPGPWCESDRGAGAWLREPANAGSDFLFLGVALWMFACCARDARAPSRAPAGSLRASPAREAVSGAVNLVHFFGTTSNHACRCHGGHVFDVFGMFGVLTFLSLHKWAQVAERAGARVSDGAFVGAQVAVCAGLWPLCQSFYADPGCERLEILGFAGSLAPAVLADAVARPAAYGPRGRACFCGAAGLLAASLACQTLDQPRHGFGAWSCAPESPFQLHALWHGGTALAAVLVFEAQRCARYETRAVNH